MTHTRKTTSGRFEAQFRGPDGTEHAKRFNSKRDAQVFLDRLGVDRQVGRWRDPRAGRVLLADWVTVWQPTTVDLRPLLSSSSRSSSQFSPKSPSVDDPDRPWRH